MIRWRIQSIADHPNVAAGRPPDGLLTATEWARYRGYHSARRRRDWLLGRLTAKQLVQDAIVRTAGFTPRLDSFSIAQDPGGAPYVASACPALACQATDGRLPLRLSISHSQDYALAALVLPAPPTTALGVDIEIVDHRNPFIHGDPLTPDEQHRIAAAPQTRQSLMATAMWSAKEAAAKAIQLELRDNPHTIQVILRPPGLRMWQPFGVEFCTRPARTHRAAMAAVYGWWRVMPCKLRPGRQYIVAVAAQGAQL